MYFYDSKFKTSILLQNTEHSFDGKGMEVTSELRLVNLTYMDNGSYQCIVDNVYGATYSTKAAITVYVFPQFLATPQDKTVQGGSNVKLKCSATGTPQPDISWQKDSGSDFPAARERRMHVDPDTDTYVIMNVKAEDMGVYTCTATNLAGSITTNISINVLEIPSFVKPMVNKSVSLGDTAVLECQASGAPKPSLVWTKNSGKLHATERHFFTADNQLLIIVKVQASDQGHYQCSMHNNLGTVSGSTYLDIRGRNSVLGGQKGGTATSVIILAVICCVIGTSAVWMIIICYTRTRSRNRRKEWEDVLDAKDVETPTSGMPLLGDHGAVHGQGCNKDDDTESERDSGTGDSKKSGDNDPGDSIVDTVIHNFLSARGEGGPAHWVNTTSLSDFDTGISSMGDSSVIRTGNSQHSLHRRGCPKIKSMSAQQKPAPQTPVTLNQQTDTGTGVSCISYAVDNPLYESLPLTIKAKDGVDVDDVAESEITSTAASLISDSVAYCGRFPAKDRDHEDTVSSVSSVPSVTVSDQPITFNTFHPMSKSQTCHSIKSKSSNCSSQPVNKRKQENRRKRFSAFELPTGETFMQIEAQNQHELATISPANLEMDVGAIMAAKEYRGGGTLPRHGLQQEWLEASLKYNEDQSKLETEMKNAKDRGSKRSIFRHSRRSQKDGAEKNSFRRSRRRSTGSGSVAGSVCQSNDEHSTVGTKNRDMF